MNPADATMEQKRFVFERFAAVALDKGFKPGWASWKYKEIFGKWPTGFVNDVRNQQACQRVADKLAAR